MKKRVVTALSVFCLPMVITLAFACRSTGEQVKPEIPGMVWIKGGTFMMGAPSDEPWRERNEYVHEVQVESFYMGTYLVTQEEYEELMGENPSHFKGEKLPVEQVNYYEVTEYCNALSLKEGLKPAYTRDGPKIILNQKANGYRLPTEYEWEYACRAGTTTQFYTGTNISTDEANYNGDKPYNDNDKGLNRRETTPVGSFAPNPWGLYDMHGNVWEWTGSYNVLDSSKPKDPEDILGGGMWIMRGGSWFDEGRAARSASRPHTYAPTKNNTLGFRLARS